MLWAFITPMMEYIQDCTRFLSHLACGRMKHFQHSRGLYFSRWLVLFIAPYFLLCFLFLFFPPLSCFKQYNAASFFFGCVGEMPAFKEYSLGLISPHTSWIKIYIIIQVIHMHEPCWMCAAWNITGLY